MGFQIPPTLPDYSKLTFLLNNSGVQKWNPAVYDILKQLILAVSQSQEVVTTSIADIPPAAPFAGVSVNGALSGNGLVATPLAVKVDGTTIIINGGDNLEVIAGSGIFVTTGHIGGGIPGVPPLVAGTIVQCVAGIANRYLVPIMYAAYCNVTQSGLAAGQGLSGTLQYHSALRALSSFTMITGGLTQVRQTLSPIVGFNIQSGDEVLANDLEIAMSGTTPSFSVPPAIPVYTWTLAYYLLTP